MSDATKNRYYQSNHWHAKLRRALIALTLAILVVLGVYLLTPILGWFGITVELQKFIEEKGKTITDAVPFVPPVFASITALAAGFYFSLSANLDFLLFSGFDREILKPVTRRTGLLSWIKPSASNQGTKHAHDVWQALKQWVQQDIGDGRWPLS